MSSALRYLRPWNPDSNGGLIFIGLCSETLLSLFDFIPRSDEPRSSEFSYCLRANLPTKQGDPSNGAWFFQLKSKP
jgi:hypothetical protein